MGELDIDLDRLDEVASRLDLRAPNKEAMDSLAYAHSWHYDVDGGGSPYECVIDSATGVGKTYVIVACVEYFAAARGYRNFAVIAPGDTIRNKTIANFTPGHRKSLLKSMESEPVLVTADNFNTPAMRAILDDDSRVKIYVFTVQALLAPTTKQGRKTHAYQEGLGSGFYDHLAALDDLLVFADEAHCYTGPAFSRTIADLDPNAIVGLTATPDKKTPIDQIIFRYPLAAAIAEKFVKTPMIVARKDDRKDSQTKLADGIKLLGYKEKALLAYCAEHDETMINPVMLVIAKDTDEADEYGDILRSDEFDTGRWKDAILVVHSNLTGADKEKALADLDSVEDADSPVRIIVSVGMLKEGWDVKNVYVIASMRASVSTVLTEQTLGRGLRLPFGQYTGREMLDTVEVLAHERYEELLQKRGVLNESFIDQRTRALLRVNSEGQTVVVTQTEDVSAPVIDVTDSGPATPGVIVAPAPGGQPVGPVFEPLDHRLDTAEEQTSEVELLHQFAPRPTLPAMVLPRVKRTASHAKFSLVQIDNLDPFTKLGRKIATDPEQELRRTKINAKIVQGPDGLRRTEIVREGATDRVDAATTLFPLATLKTNLSRAVLTSATIEQRPEEARALRPIIDAFIGGMGDHLSEEESARLLSAFQSRAEARLIELIQAEQRKRLSVPTWDWAVDTTALGKVRSSTRAVEPDTTGPFVKGGVYGPWKRGLYEFAWFDSKPERSVANIVDGANTVSSWARLHRNDLPLVWNSDSREYNPDLVVIESDGTHWLVEAKMNKEMTADEVRDKRKAAVTWANLVNASGKVEGTWKYLLLSEDDIDQSQESWPALKNLGS